MASDTEESSNKVTIYLLFTIIFSLFCLRMYRQESIHLFTSAAYTQERQFPSVAAVTCMSLIDKNMHIRFYVFIINACVCLKSTRRTH